MRNLLVLVALCLMALLAACEPPGPTQTYTSGGVLLTENFDDPDAWETFSMGQEEGSIQSSQFFIEDGVYRATADEGGFIWGINQTVHTDVVIEVLATQNSTFDDNFFGVMCRADPNNNGDGYYFLVSGDGFVTIAYGHDTSVDPLVDPRASSAVNKGQANNVIRAVCIGNYLALYVNGTFVADVTDSAFASGNAGMAVSSNGSDDSSVDDTVDISFDNLTISEASIESS